MKLDELGETRLVTHYCTVILSGVRHERSRRIYDVNLPTKVKFSRNQWIL